MTIGLLKALGAGRREARDNFYAIMTSEHLWHDVHMGLLRCPDCLAVVKGRHDAKQHRDRHLDEEAELERLYDLLEELCKRTGITEEDVQMPWKWTAVVGGQDAIEDGDSGGG